MDSSLSIAGVHTTDYHVRADRAKVQKNFDTLKKLLGHQTKLTGKMRNLCVTPGRVQFSLSSHVIGDRDIKLETSGTDVPDDPTMLRGLDHFDGETPGGNSANEKALLDLLFRNNYFTGPPPVAYFHPVERRIFHVSTPGGTTFVIGDQYPDNVSEFLRFKDNILQSGTNSTELNFADLFKQELGAGHRSLINSTSSKHDENGAISLRSGRAPALAMGLKEIAPFLRGVAHNGNALYDYKKQRIVHADALDDSSQFFEYGTLNPTVRENIDRFGWQYSKLFYEGSGRKSSFPCDLVLTAGAAGGAVRLQDTWAFSSIPGPEGSRRIGQLIDQHNNLPESKERLTDKNIVHTPGCGDAVAALQAYINTQGEKIHRMLSEVPCNNPWVNEQRIEIASLVYISILMRVYGELMLHTKGTRLTHLQDSSLIKHIHHHALWSAVGVGASVDPAKLHPRREMNIALHPFEINLSLWKQSFDREWPESPEPDLHGVVNDTEYEGPGLSIAKKAKKDAMDSAQL